MNKILGIIIFCLAMTAHADRFLTEDRGIYLSAEPFYSSSKGISLEHWKIYALNIYDDPQCITLSWKLIDYKWVQVNKEIPSGAVLVGYLYQRPWVIDGVPIVLDSSAILLDAKVSDCKGQ